MARIPGLSPHHGTHSIFPDTTQVPAAMRLREDFLNDLAPSNFRSAIELFERLWALHEVARFDYNSRHAATQALGKTRPYAGKRGAARKIRPPEITGLDFSPKQLALVKIYWPETWPLPEPGQRKPTRRQVRKGTEKIRRAIYDFLSDGMFPRERAVHAIIDKKFGQKGPAPVADESLLPFRKLTASKRFEAVSAYYRRRWEGDRTNDAVAHFIPQQTKWRKEKSFHACRALSYVDRELAAPGHFTATQLSLFETKYHVSKLPPFPHLKHIASQTARLAICMEASLQVRPNSQILRLDLKLAEEIAKKYNAYLAAAKSASPILTYKQLI